MATVQAPMALLPLLNNNPTPLDDTIHFDARVRQARLEDLSQITPLFCSSLDVSIPDKSSAMSSAYDLSLINDLVMRQCFPEKDRVQTYVVEEATTSRIQGFAIVKSLEPEKSHELNQLVVPAVYRSKRTMNLLMNFLQAQHREHGLWVRVIKRCEKACRFYKKWRFNYVREMEADGVNETVVIMYWPGDSARR